MPPPKSTPDKKQQSISRFFVPKSTPKSTVNGLNLRSPEPSSPDVPSDEGEHRNPVQKRPLGEDADLANNGKERVSKRSKTDSGDDENITISRTEKDAPEKIATACVNDSKSVPTARTARYLHSSSPHPEDTDDEASRKRKEQLHKRFVKKLGHPDSIAQIKRRHWQADAEATPAEDEDGEEDEDPAPKAVKKKGAKTGKLTPMEIQMLEIKRNHLDAILIVEVGYKFKFFGEDARIAAKELGIVCIPGKFRFDEHPSEAHLDRFASASIPVHRLPVHAKRLVAAGHKVGVVRQIETAALKKAGDNRNTPFIRKLTNLYTKGTYIDDVDGLDQTNGPSGGAPASGHLLCLTETSTKGHGNDEKVDVGILAVQPATGDVIYDNFEDGFMRSDIETRLLHISPCEILIVGDLTRATEKLVQHLSGSKTTVFGDKIRVERVEKGKTVAAQAYSHVTQFYAAKLKDHHDGEEDQAAKMLDKILNLAEPVMICLSAMIKHMTEYGLEHVFNLTKYFQSFSARSHMLLNGNTLSSLEIYRNSSDYTERGSLFWALDKTQTKFGQRLLRKWVGRPLIDRARLEERLSAVEEIKDGSTEVHVDKLKCLFMKIKSDLERNLLRIYYGRCSRPELLVFLQAMQRISVEYASLKKLEDTHFQSTIISESLLTLPAIGDIVVTFLDKINPAAARDDDKYAFFRENEETDEITEFKLGIATVESELDAHRPIAAGKIKKKNVTYSTVAGIEYLIEVPNTDLKNVPASWMKISGTKKLSRFHTPEVVKMVRERDQYKESLAAACDTAFKDFLTEISKQYQALRDCLQALATLDCLVSLATVASQPGYSKPSYTDNNEIRIEEGRHPMVEQLLLDSYVPNDTNLSTDSRALLITGPNMGGKSSYVRQVALIAIMAQIGSYVPAKSTHLGLLDAVYTRMGAFDNIFAGESTFMVELTETSTILKTATPRSLVILDELGRGTSTHDGVAIAHAVLDYVVRDLKCLTMFITHYQTLSSVERTFPNGELRNVHMGFHSEMSRDNEDTHEEITFLYRLVSGVSHRSYGLNVARLAGIPRGVLAIAAHKSAEMEQKGQQKKLKAFASELEKLLTGVDDSSYMLDLIQRGVEEF